MCRGRRRLELVGNRVVELAEAAHENVAGENGRGLRLGKHVAGASAGHHGVGAEDGRVGGEHAVGAEDGVDVRVRHAGEHHICGLLRLLYSVADELIQAMGNVALRSALVELSVLRMPVRRGSHIGWQKKLLLLKLLLLLLSLERSLLSLSYLQLSEILRVVGVVWIHGNGSSGKVM